MKKLIKNTKGAVTVFVTLLLIPAMLISGTAVDLARLHTARSIIQDANQLAANATLTQYNSLLYDLYAIFGIAQDDPILGALLDEYISVSVFGESTTDRGLGTLQLFYGSDITADEPYFPDGKNLRNTDVLRRQIEEYMKFRAPVIIVKEFMELLGMSTFGNDAAVISDKLEVEETIAEIFNKYKELYNAITEADRFDKRGDVVGGTVGTVSSSLELIRTQFADLAANFSEWSEESDPEKKEDLAKKHRAILENIRIRILGGRIGSNWNNGSWSNTVSSSAQGLERTVSNAIINADTYKVIFDNIVRIAREIDGLTVKLSGLIDSLESKLYSGEINEELKAALTQKTGSPPKSIIEKYRDMLKWNNIESMANIFKDGGYHYIDDILKPLLEGVIYRHERNPSFPSFTREELANATSLANLRLSESNKTTMERLSRYVKDNITYKMPPGFVMFKDHPGNNGAFFRELEEFLKQPAVPLTSLYDGQREAAGANSQEKQENMINQLKELVDTAIAGLKNEPLGARHINSKASSGGAEDMGNFLDLIKSTVNSPIATVISDPLGSVGMAADYLLLLTYSTSMFSNYTTGRPEITGKSRDEIKSMELPKTITTITLSPRVNYFFQSEWEYLYNGSENASQNLSAITRLIFTIRLICNYVAVFSVSEITAVVNGIRAAFAWNPPLGLILGELARAAFVAAESAIDVARLRGGHKVPLIKNVKNREWVSVPSGVIKALESIKNSNADNEKRENEDGLTYSNYMAFLFVAKAIFNGNAGDELAKRTGDLIEWNVINYKNNIYSDERKMESALGQAGQFKLEDMKTDFSLTTSVDMRMLFLSMIFAQNFSDSRGMGMLTRMPVTVTDYRGY